MSDDSKTAGSVFEQVTAYVNTRVSQAKLSVAEKLSQGIALLVAVLLSALVFFLSFCLLSAAAAILIGQWLGSLWLGFAIMAFFVLLAGVLIWKLRGRLFQIPLLNKLLTVFFEKDRNEKDEKD